MGEILGHFGRGPAFDPAGNQTGTGVRRGLTDALRDAVRTGRLAPGTRCPPPLPRRRPGHRPQHGRHAYANLVAEGWLTAARAPAPTSPWGTPTPLRQWGTRRPAHGQDPPRRPQSPPSTSPPDPDLASFPRTSGSRPPAAPSPPPRTRPRLRRPRACRTATALATTSPTRGVRADPSTS